MPPRTRTVHTCSLQCTRSLFQPPVTIVTPVKRAEVTLPILNHMYAAQGADTLVATMIVSPSSSTTAAGSPAFSSMNFSTSALCSQSMRFSPSTLDCCSFPNFFESRLRSGSQTSCGWPTYISERYRSSLVIETSGYSRDGGNATYAVIVFGKVVHEVLAGGVNWVVGRDEAYYTGKLLYIVPYRVSVGTLRWDLYEG